MAAHGQFRLSLRENGLPLLRCANNGVTCFIDAHGAWCQKVFRDGNNSEYGTGALNVEVPLLAPEDKSVATFTTGMVTGSVGVVSGWRWLDSSPGGWSEVMIFGCRWILDGAD